MAPRRKKPGTPRISHTPEEMMRLQAMVREIGLEKQRVEGVTSLLKLKQIPVNIEVDVEVDRGLIEVDTGRRDDEGIESNDEVEEGDEEERLMVEKKRKKANKKEERKPKEDRGEITGKKEGKSKSSDRTEKEGQEDEEARRARKKQRKLRKEQQKKREDESESEGDEAGDDEETKRRIRKQKKALKKKVREKGKRVEKGINGDGEKEKSRREKGKDREVIDSSPVFDAPISSPTKAHSTPTPSPEKPRKSKKRSRDSDAAPSDKLRDELDSSLSRKKRKLTNGSSSSSTTIVTSTSALEARSNELIADLRSAPSFAREAGLLGEGVVNLFANLVERVAKAETNGPIAEKEKKRKQEKKARNRIEAAPEPSSSVPSSTLAVVNTSSGPTEPAETAEQATLRRRAEKAGRAKLRREKRDRKRLKKEARRIEKGKMKEVIDDQGLAEEDEEEDVEEEEPEEDKPAPAAVVPSPSPKKDRPKRVRLGKKEKELMRSMESSRASSVALPGPRGESPVKKSISTREQEESDENTAMRGLIHSSPSKPQIPAEDAVMRDNSASPIASVPAVNGAHEETRDGDGQEADQEEKEEEEPIVNDEEEIDQLASTQNTPSVSQFSRFRSEQPPSALSAVSSEDDPEEVALSLRTHASPMRKQQMALAPEPSTSEDPRTGDEDSQQEPETEDEVAVEEKPAAPIDPRSVPLPPSPSPPPRVQTIGNTDDGSEGSSSSDDDDDSDSSSSSTASNRPFRKPSRPSLGAVAANAFGSPASLRKNQHQAVRKRLSSPLKTSQLAASQESSNGAAGAEEDEEELDQLLTQPVTRSTLQHLLRDEDDDDIEEKRRRYSSSSAASNGDIPAEANEDDPDQAPNVNGEAEPSASIKDAVDATQQTVNGDAADSPPRLSDIGGQPSSAPGTPFKFDSQASHLVRATQQNGTLQQDDHDDVESQFVPIKKDKPLFLEATQQPTQHPAIDEEPEQSSGSDESADEQTRVAMGTQKPAVNGTNGTSLQPPLEVLLTPGRVTRGALARARTASPVPAVPVSPVKRATSRPPPASQPLPPRLGGRASSMRSLSQLDDTTPRRSMRHALSSSQSTQKLKNGSQSWVAKKDDEEDDDEESDSDNEEAPKKENAGMNGGSRKMMLWS